MNKNKLLLIVFIISMAYTQAQDSVIIRLWEQDAPGAKGNSELDQPTMYFFKSQTKSNKGVLICPGGGYNHLAIEKEGFKLAHWFIERGVNAYVLRYRHNHNKNGYHYPAPIDDATRGMRYAKYHLSALNNDSVVIGIMGFSAGGHLASSISTHFDSGDPNSSDPIEKFSSRPDFSILVYPVITLSKPFKHKGTRDNFIGKGGDSTLAKKYSNELHVSPQTPPTILIHAADDKAVPVMNSLVYAQALARKQVSFELHILPTGGHGFGMAQNKPEINRWLNYLEDWINVKLK